MFFNVYSFQSKLWMLDETLKVHCWLDQRFILTLHMQAHTTYEICYNEHYNILIVVVGHIFFTLTLRMFTPLMFVQIHCTFLFVQIHCTFWWFSYTVKCLCTICTWVASSTCSGGLEKKHHIFCSDGSDEERETAWWSLVRISGSFCQNCYLMRIDGDREAKMM